MQRWKRAAFAVFAILTGGCAFNSTAADWNGLSGPDGEHHHLMATSKAGLKLFVVVPFIGNTSIDGMVDRMTGDIKRAGGDRVRFVQAETESYWYGFPPLTWVFTPVVSTVLADFVLPQTGETAHYDRDRAGTVFEAVTQGFRGEIEAPPEGAR